MSRRKSNLSAHPNCMRNSMVAVVLVVLVAGSLGVGYFAGYNNRQTITTTSTVLLSTTITQTVQTTELSRSNSNYSFSIRLNGTTIVKGQEISLFYNLTNISGKYQKVGVIIPLVIPTIQSENGSYVWLKPPQSFTGGATNLPNGFSLSANLLIPTSNMSAAQKYLLSVGPLIGPFVSKNDTYGFLARYYPIGESLMINTTITIT
jgi:hypothetical protein